MTYNLPINKRAELRDELYIALLHADMIFKRGNGYRFYRVSIPNISNQLVQMILLSGDTLRAISTLCGYVVENGIKALVELCCCIASTYNYGNLTAMYWSASGSGSRK